MTEADVERWLAAYGEAWETRDGDAAAAIFTEDGTYAWGPWEEDLLRGRAAIRERWAQATEGQRDVRFGSEVLGVVDAGGVARWWCRFDAPETSTSVEIEGIFLIRLTPNGLCSGFREWFNGRTTPVGTVAE